MAHEMTMSAHDSSSREQPWQLRHLARPAPPTIRSPRRALARGAAEPGLGLKLLGGLAVRVLCPGFPPRLRAGQDMDFACLSKGRKNVAAYLERSGCQPDRRFNNLNGDRQMYFNAPSGRPIDVMVDRLTMCHTLDLRPSFGSLPLTVDAVDVLLSKLQIVELNEKDARDILHLLGRACRSGRRPTRARHSSTATASPSCSGADWGWWRTVTGSLAKLPALAAEHPHLLPPDPPFDPLAQARVLQDLAESAPKSMKWKLRANVGRPGALVRAARRGRALAEARARR